MTSQWDEFSKSLAEESLPRRESLRRLGFLFAGAVLSPLGMGSAWARETDPCRAFCRCRKGRQQTQCLEACRECNMDTSRLVGTCGDYYCCGSSTPCGNYCADLASDPYNCGACGYICAPPGAYEYVACIDGQCRYACAEGAVRCNGTCTYLEWDPSNCGGCGHICEPPSGPNEYVGCVNGSCEYACAEGAVRCSDGTCMYVGWDPNNCGACGNVCPGSAPYCDQGVCVCPWGMAVCDGECIHILNNPDNCGACGAACPSSAPYCHYQSCSDQPCIPGQTWCDESYCAYLDGDRNNCGACGAACPWGMDCSGGECYWPYDYGPWIDF